MRKTIFCGLAALVFAALLLIAGVWLWGYFSGGTQGSPSARLPVAANVTELDRALQPLLAQHDAQASAAVLLTDPMDAFVARARSARSAGRSLDLQYYIWNQDLTGRLLLRELISAADRGVRVRLLLDDISAGGKDKTLLTLATHKNIEVRLFNPTRNRSGALRRGLEMLVRFVGFNRRMHNKAWIADGRVAVVGGRNVGDEYFGAGDTNFRDSDLLLLGQAVEQTEHIFDRFWNSPAVVPMQSLHREHTSTWSDEELAAQRQNWKQQAANSRWYQALIHSDDWLQRVQTLAQSLHWSRHTRVVSDPPEKASAFRDRQDRANWLLYDVMALLFSAQKQSWIISPYFVPGAAGELMLSAQARRHVDVRVLTNSLKANDVPLVHAGYAHYRKGLLRNGVQLHELKPGAGTADRSWMGSGGGASLHSKGFVVDGRRGFVGSFNFDPRSAQLNTEMGVLFDDASLAADLQAFFKDSTKPEHAWTVTLTDNDDLRWRGGRDKIWHHEPETHWYLRALTWLLGLLPMESQL